MKRYLIVAAHPDDELLGAGATMSKALSRGDKVYVCIMSRTCSTRDDDLLTGVKKSYGAIRVDDFMLGKFECLRFDNTDHRTMVQFVEDAIRKYEPTDVITHHPSDANPDHYVTSRVCQEAVRLPQRQLGYTKRIYNFSYMEVQTSTDFGLNHSWGRFTPNTYVGVSEQDLMNKISALSVYKDVLRPVPYPRSEQNIKALASVRGSEAGYPYAEAFQTVFRIEE